MLARYSDSSSPNSAERLTALINKSEHTTAWALLADKSLRQQTNGMAITSIEPSRLWCVAERESGLRARHHNTIQQPLNDAQMLAALLRSINGAHNWDCAGVIRFISRSRCVAHQCNPQLCCVAERESGLRARHHNSNQWRYSPAKLVAMQSRPISSPG